MWWPWWSFGWPDLDDDDDDDDWELYSYLHYAYSYGFSPWFIPIPIITPLLLFILMAPLVFAYVTFHQLPKALFPILIPKDTRGPRMGAYLHVFGSVWGIFTGLISALFLVLTPKEFLSWWPYAPTDLRTTLLVLLPIVGFFLRLGYDRTSLLSYCITAFGLFSPLSMPLTRDILLNFGLKEPYLSLFFIGTALLLAIPYALEAFWHFVRNMLLDTLVLGASIPLAAARSTWRTLRSIIPIPPSLSTSKNQEYSSFVTVSLPPVLWFRLHIGSQEGFSVQCPICAKEVHLESRYLPWGRILLPMRVCMHFRSAQFYSPHDVMVGFRYAFGKPLIQPFTTFTTKPFPRVQTERMHHDSEQRSPS